MTASSTRSKSTLDALPKQFVASMRTLFDLMDDKRSGLVRLSDIEKRWRDAGAPTSRQQQQSGAIDSLRKVTPPNGLLTFERFCAGLRICLLRHDRQPAGGKGSSRPASVPLPEREHGRGKMVGKALRPSNSAERLLLSPVLRAQNTATVRPNNVSQQRAISMPQLAKAPGRRDSPAMWGKSDPAKAPMDRLKVSVALEKWRVMKSYERGPPQGDRENVGPPPPHPLREGRHRNSASYPSLPSSRDQVSTSDDSGVSLRVQDRGPAAKKANRRRESRRHTVSSGVDYNMIKRLKLLEQEKDFLLQGLDVVERARNWYVRQIANINDKLDRVSKWDTAHSEYSMDAHNERLNFQMTRIYEVNQHLNSLMETSEKGFPIHMNLAVHQRNIYGEQKISAQTIQRLKSQNYALTEEIGKKGEKITQLEAEKSALIRELFHARSHFKKDPNDTTLW